MSKALSRALLLAALGAAPITSAAAQSAPRPMRYTEAQLDAIGDTIVKTEIRRYGLATNEQWTRDVGMLLDKLRAAAGIPKREFEWHLVASDQFNAMAIPGNRMIVYSGLLNTLEQVAAKQFPNDPAKARDLYLRYTAAVLGHELAHHTLGHTNGEGPQMPVRRTPASADRQPASAAERLEQQMNDPSVRYRYAWTRGREEAADRTGSLYLLRMGYGIEDAMNLFRVMDAVLERGESEGRSEAEPMAKLRDSVLTLTWLMDHPRSIDRMGMLESFRGELRRDQARYDDALVLVRTGLQLDTAVTLLDTVLAHFPDLKEAKHLRAAALQQKYFRQSGVENLGIRALVATYPARFYQKVRGSGALEQARAAYRDILRVEVLPFALGNLAVLDAYAGDMALARARADSAVTLLPDSYEMLVNRGVVRYLGGQYREAMANFDAAAAKGGAESPIVVFDRARTRLALGDSAAGRDMMRTYAARYDDWSDWHRYALALAGGGNGAKQAGTSAVAASSGTTPVASPVALGTSAARVRAVLGAPQETEQMEAGTRWRYATRGLDLLLKAAGVHAVILREVGAGSVDGVKVGADARAAVTAWGRPVAREDGVTYFRKGGAIVGVAVSDDEKIGALLLTREDR